MKDKTLQKLIKNFSMMDFLENSWERENSQTIKNRGTTSGLQ